MAKPQNPLIGKTTKSIGNTTFSNWKGINYIRNKRKNTFIWGVNALAINAFRMQAIRAFAKELKPALPILFQLNKPNTTPQNNFIKMFINASTVSVNPPDIQIQYPLLRWSLGTLPTTPVTEIIFDNPTGNIYVYWSTTLSNPLFNNTDSAILIITPNNDLEPTGSFFELQRADNFYEGTIQNNLPPGTIIYVYLSFYSNISGKVSTSIVATFEVP